MVRDWQTDSPSRGGSPFSLQKKEASASWPGLSSSLVWTFNILSASGLKGWWTMGVCMGEGRSSSMVLLRQPALAQSPWNPHLLTRALLISLWGCLVFPPLWMKLIFFFKFFYVNDFCYAIQAFNLVSFFLTVPHSHTLSWLYPYTHPLSSLAPPIPTVSQLAPSPLLFSYLSFLAHECN